MRTANQTIDTFAENFTKAQDYFFDNQDVALGIFNDFLKEHQDIKEAFFAMSKAERKEAFLYFLRQAMGQIAINETFKGE
jgi:hypothetical protein